jgi:hypothetical protein
LVDLTAETIASFLQEAFFSQPDWIRRRHGKTRVSACVMILFMKVRFPQVIANPL